MNKIRVKSAITSKDGVTLYTADGKEINLPATGWRTKSIMDEILRPLARREEVEIDLDNYSLESRVEAKSGGIIKFIRRKLKDFVGHFNLGSYGEPVVDPKHLPKDPEPHLYYTGGALAPSKPDLPEQNPEDETLVAVVNGVEIPGMERLEKQIEYAALHNAVGLQKFLERIAKTIDKRGHTVQELLNFMQKADLPIADDGSIIGYKILRSKGEGKFVDCHSGKVTQRIGSHVSMSEKLVDPSRSRECSVGLHIARRAYIRNFPGDVVTLIKIAPEDVIAVPNYDANKMRAASYHLVALLPKEAYDLLRADKPMTTHAPSAKILANVIAGDHIGITETVVIGAAKGGDLTITAVGDVNQVSAAETKQPEKKAHALDEVSKDTASVTVKEVKKVISETVAERKAEPVKKVEPVKEKPKKAPVKKPSSKPIPAKVLAAAQKPIPVVAEPKAAPVTKGNKQVPIPDKYREAYEKVKSGEISQREAERKYNVSGKKLRQLRRQIEGK